MKYLELNNILISRFPELETVFTDVFKFWGEEVPPQHIFFGTVLNEYVSGLLRKNDESEQLDKVFQFYEELAGSNDCDVRDLLQVTLLEYLWNEKTVFDTAKHYMLPKTALLNDRIKKYLHEPTE